MPELSSNQAKFQEIVWQIDDMALKISECVRIFNDYNMEKFSHLADGTRNLEYFSTMGQNEKDLKIALNSFFNDLKIQADCLAKIIPYFYGKKFWKNLDCKSFTNHIKHFVKKDRELDTEYTKILENDLKWFKLLAGEDGKESTGHREILTHHAGRYEIYPLRVGDKFFPKIRLIKGFKVISEDIINDIKFILRDYFNFLDLLTVHFLKKKEKFQFDSCYFTFKNSSDNYWLFPEI